MERFALAAAVVLGFALTAALCSLFVPLRRVLERREQNQQPVQSEQPRPAPLRAPLWGGLCAAAGTVAAVGVGWLAACVGQPELLGSEGRLMTRLLTALAGSLAFGAVGLAEDLARMRSPAALGLRRDVRLLLEALAAAFVLLLLRAAGCLPRGLGVPGAGYVLLGSAVPFLWAVLMVALAECARHYTGKKPVIVSPDIRTGLTMGVDEPRAVGKDRLVDAAYAATNFPLPVITVDLGTATTFNVVDKDRVFRGGVICPGLSTGLRALGERCAQLPQVHLGSPKKAIGTNTESCMLSGSVLGTAVLIDGMVQRIEEELGSPATLVVTGGLAKYVTPLCRHPLTYDPELLMKGLALLYQLNAPQEHGRSHGGGRHYGQQGRPRAKHPHPNRRTRPLGTEMARSSGNAGASPPTRCRIAPPAPAPPGFSLGDARGEAPCIRKL